MEYNVKLTEREVRALGERRWQGVVAWRLTGIIAVIAIWVIFLIVLAVLKTEIGTLARWLLLVAATIPPITLAVWFMQRVTKVGKNFLEKVKYENMSRT